MDDISPTLPPLDRLTRDLANASATLSEDEARFLVELILPDAGKS